MFDFDRVIDIHYRSMYPFNLIIMNAVIVDDDWNLLWTGNLDCTLDITILKKCSKNLNKRLTVLWSTKDYQIKSRYYVLTVDADFIDLGYEVAEYVNRQTLKYY